jgi:hypothetical protein
MANDKSKSISFDSIIQAGKIRRSNPRRLELGFNSVPHSDRQKKKQEDLANQLLGKNRRSSAPGSGSGAGRKGQNKTQTAKPGSLASRIGVAKV